jgi:hypothetical protein
MSGPSELLDLVGVLAVYIVNTRLDGDRALFVRKADLRSQNDIFSSDTDGLSNTYRYFRL